MSVAVRLRCGYAVAQRTQQVRLERTRAGADGARSAELRQLRHLQALVAAGIDAAEGFQIKGHVHGEAVIAAAPAHAHPDARELAAVDVHTGGAAPALGADAKLRRQIDDAALQRRDELTDRNTRAPEIHQRVHHQLYRAVIGHLAAAIDVH